MLGKDKEIDALLPLQRCVKHLFYMFLGELHRERTLITKELKGANKKIFCAFFYQRGSRVQDFPFL